MKYEDDIRKLLVELSSEIRKIKSASSGRIDKINEDIGILNNYIKLVDETPKDIDTLDKDQLINIIKSYKTDELSEDDIIDVLQQLDVPIETAKGIKSNIPLEFEEDDKEAFDRFKDLLNKVIDSAKRNKDIVSMQSISVMGESNKYVELYDKLRQNSTGTDLFTGEDIDLVTNFYSTLDASKKDPKNKKDYISLKNVLIYISALNQAMFMNITKNLNTPSVVPPATNYSQSIDDITFKALCTKYNIPFAKMSQTDIDNFCKLKYSSIESIFRYIDSTSEYDFIKTNATTGNYKLLYAFCKDSKPSILDYLKNDSVARKIKLENILQIPGVHKPVKKTNPNSSGPVLPPSPGPTGPTGPSGSPGVTSTAGSYEHYVQISQLLDNFSQRLRKRFNNNSIDLYGQAFDNHKTLFTNNPDLVRRNIEIIETYGLSNTMTKYAISNTVKKLSAFSTYLFTDSNLMLDIDVAIETSDELADYISKYTSIFNERAKIYHAAHEERKGASIYNRFGKMVQSITDNTGNVDLELDSLKGFFAKNYLANTVPSRLLVELEHNPRVTASLTDTIIQDLDNKYLVHNNRFPNLPVYNINGTLVSANKFKRNWEAVNSYNNRTGKTISNEDMLIISMVYPGTYDDIKYQNIENFAKSQTNLKGGRII